jgi:perosamine synthetase
VVAGRRQTNAPAEELMPRRLTIWAPLPLSAYRERAQRSLPFPLNMPNYRLFSRARHGLFQGIGALGLRPGDSVLMPAYHHGSEVEAFVRAGVDCRVYEVSETLEPDAGELESLLDASVRALYLIHYFGFPQQVHRWRAWCDERELLLIEDAAMAFLSSWQGRPIGSFGDLAIYCVYKTFGLPDGGAMICAEASPYPQWRQRLGIVPAVKRHGSWLALRRSSVARVHALVRGEEHYNPEADFDLGDPGTPPTRATVALLPRLARWEVAERRRRNYRYLFDRLANDTEPLFTSLPDGASPVAFLMSLHGDRQREVQRSLRAAGIRAANFWPYWHPTIPAKRFERSNRLRADVVGLPVHQELQERDLESIVDCVRTAIGRSV